VGRRIKHERERLVNTLFDESKPSAYPVERSVVTAARALHLDLQLPPRFFGHELAGAQLGTGCGYPYPHDAMPEVLAASRLILFFPLLTTKSESTLLASAERICSTSKLYMLKNLPFVAPLDLGDVRSAAAGTSFLRLKNREKTDVSALICASNALGMRP
jgi:hypothetical protein